ncbi:LicD family protein [Actinomyces trachealis]|uniref:LicD family protein n=1 Tax=Actinomyces trachealis TaxID=2763540 RepID=UPI001892BA9F|nr:LicD family protein [Actinomyces trachealis]
MNGNQDGDLLHQVQRATTRVLAEFDRVCKELSTPYAAYGGTAIGAVRHGGFIPWDDDADVCMRREDYERFLREAPAALKDEFVLMSPRSHPDYPKTFAVLGLEGTEFTPGDAEGREFKVPIGVDIFPLDRMPVDVRSYRRQNRHTWLWGRMLFLHGSATPQAGLNGLVGQAASAVFHGVHGGLHLARVKPAQLYRLWEHAARQYEGSGSPLLGDYATQAPRHWSAKESELFPTVRVPFEGIMVEIPRAFDAVLTRWYGDYMSLPPEEERVNHSAVRVDFGKHDFSQD